MRTLPEEGPLRAQRELRIGRVAFGRFHPIDDPEERVAALAAFTNKLLPGRWDEVRPPNANELKGTMILAMEIDQASAKVRLGPPDDDSEDAALEVWAGELPIVTSFGEPIPSPGLRPGIPIASSIRDLQQRKSGRTD